MDKDVNEASFDSMFVPKDKIVIKKVHSHSEPRRNLLKEDAIKRQMTKENILNKSLQKSKLSMRQNIIIPKQSLNCFKPKNLNFSFRRNRDESSVQGDIEESDSFQKYDNYKVASQFSISKHQLHSLDVNNSED